jgi:hypothetical protein
VVDIYDTSTDSWTTASLSEAKDVMGSAGADSKVLFGGGMLAGVILTNTVDIFTEEAAPEIPTSVTGTVTVEPTGGTITLTEDMTVEATGELTLNVTTVDDLAGGKVITVKPGGKIKLQGGHVVTVLAGTLYKLK